MSPVRLASSPSLSAPEEVLADDDVGTRLLLVQLAHLIPLAHLGPLTAGSLLIAELPAADFHSPGASSEVAIPASQQLSQHSESTRASGILLDTSADSAPYGSPSSRAAAAPSAAHPGVLSQSAVIQLPVAESNDGVQQQRQLVPPLLPLPAVGAVFQPVAAQQLAVEGEQDTPLPGGNAAPSPLSAEILAETPKSAQPQSQDAHKQATKPSEKEPPALLQAGQKAGNSIQLPESQLDKAAHQPQYQQQHKKADTDKLEQQQNHSGPAAQMAGEGPKQPSIEQQQQADKTKKQDAAKPEQSSPPQDAPPKTAPAAKPSSPAPQASQPAQKVAPPPKPAPPKQPPPAKPSAPARTGPSGSKQQQQPASKVEKKKPLPPAVQAASDFARSLKTGFRAAQGQAPERVVSSIRAFGSSLVPPQPPGPPVKGGSSQKGAAAVTAVPPMKQLSKAVMPKADPPVPQAFLGRRREQESSVGSRLGEGGKSSGAVSARSPLPASGPPRGGSESAKAESSRARDDDDEDDEDLAKKAKRSRGEAAAKTVQMIFDVLGTGYSRLGTTIVTFDYSAAAVSGVSATWNVVSTACYDIAMADYEKAGQRAGAAVSVQMRRLVTAADSAQEALTSLSVETLITTLSNRANATWQVSVSGLQSWSSEVADHFSSMKRSVGGFDFGSAFTSAESWVTDRLAPSQSDRLSSWGGLLKSSFVTKPMEEIVRPLSAAVSDATQGFRDATATEATKLRSMLQFEPDSQPSTVAPLLPQDSAISTATSAASKRGDGSGSSSSSSTSGKGDNGGSGSSSGDDERGHNGISSNEGNVSNSGGI